MITRAEIADRLEKVIANGFNMLKVARVAFDLYQDPDRERDIVSNRILLQLTAMEEGPEFHLSQEECLKLVAKLRDSSS